MHTFNTRGTCSRQINFDIVDGNVHNVSFVGGCDGNLKAISKLIEGKPVDWVVSVLEGNTCGRRTTSCADQLTQALKAAEAGEINRNAFVVSSKEGSEHRARSPPSFSVPVKRYEHLTGRKLRCAPLPRLER